MNALDLYNKITKQSNGFKPRPSQQIMVKAIDRVLSRLDDSANDGSNILLVEAPTGTGKSLAYLIAGVSHSITHEKKLLITTATKTLQSQLVNKDVPNFVKSSEIKCSYGLAKGRSNYLCPQQLDLNLQAIQEDMFNAGDKTKKILGEIKQLHLDKEWDGDLDQIPLPIDNEIRALVTTDKERCLNYSCPYNKKEDSSCPFYLNKEHLRQCDVIVTNHSLLLADLALGGGNVLPFDPSEYVLCIDEAHNFAEIAIDNFMGMLDLNLTLVHVKNLENFIYNSQTQTYVSTQTAWCEALLRKVLELIEHMENYTQLLSYNSDAFNDNRLILNDYINPVASQFCEVYINFALLSHQISVDLLKLQQELKDELKQTANYLTQTSLDKLGYYLGVIDAINVVSNYIISQDDSRYNCHAKWIELKVNTKNELNFLIHAGRAHAGRMLDQFLWSNAYAVILTSATLAVSSDFDYYISNLGLNSYNNLRKLKINSDFAYNTQAQIVVPRFKYIPEYGSSSQFNQELKTYLETQLNYSNAYGTLVLFFNRTTAQEIYDQLPFKIRSKILLQMDYSSNRGLINQHIENIDSGKPSIIFGLNSFAEGVDLPALYCMHVIITKLPFETFRDPQNITQEYWFKFEKANYFAEVALPQACIKLIQASGRLIRHENDYGQVTICDNRIISKSYGSKLLNALPNFSRKYNDKFIDLAYAKLSNAGNN